MVPVVHFCSLLGLKIKLTYNLDVEKKNIFFQFINGLIIKWQCFKGKICKYLKNIKFD